MIVAGTHLTQSVLVSFILRQQYLMYVSNAVVPRKKRKYQNLYKLHTSHPISHLKVGEDTQFWQDSANWRHFMRVFNHTRIFIVRPDTKSLPFNFSSQFILNIYYI